MRRSACPSIVWKKKKLEDGSALGLDANGEEVISGDKVNHLDMYKEKENIPVEPVLIEEYEGRRSRHEPKVIKKNFVLNSGTSVPICFAVHFVNLNRTAKKNLQGFGTHAVDSYALYAQMNPLSFVEGHEESNKFDLSKLLFALLLTPFSLFRHRRGIF